jgi:hypothetical protein
MTFSGQPVVVDRRGQYVMGPSVSTSVGRVAAGLIRAA